MAVYSISYTRPGEGVFEHKMTAKSDVEARMRFLNLSWVAFTAISINSIAIASDQPDEDKAAARKAGGKATKAPAAGKPETGAVILLSKAKPVDPHSLKPYTPPPPPPPTVGSLSAEIERLQEKRAKALGRNDHYSASALSERINQAKRERHELLRNGRTGETK